ncbi:MAG TPA: VWA domain-containing protein, partial [Alphaproteobacteria bacterium]|nr:VWA domain-containing protein [Alphaproteobacteria bacterium]
ERVLKHAISEARARKVAALVYVGDCCEEAVDPLCGLAGELGMLGVKAFMFQEGRDPTARRAFEGIAQLTGGAYCPFDASSAQQLRDLLTAVAVYAAGGRKALESYGRSAGSGVAGLLSQLK